MHYDMFDAGIHIELTSNCNSRCLDCNRYVRGTDILNPHVTFGSKAILTTKDIKRIFDEETSSNAKYVMFSGTYGDASLHPQFHTVLHTIANQIEKVKDQRIKKGLDEKLILMMETNGGMHSDDWWIQFGNIVGERFQKWSRVIFALDGSDDETHQMYRRGVPMQKVLQHAKAYMGTGQRAVWSFIEFAHNEHQVKKAKKIAAKNGFYQFKIRRSRLRNKTSVPQEIPNNLQKKKNISSQSLNYTSNDSKLFDTTLTSNISDDSMYFDKDYDKKFVNTDIKCEWRDKKQISIDYTGRVWQCCYFSNFYHNPIDEIHLGRASKEDLNKKSIDYENLGYYVDTYENNWNNIKYHTLSEVMNHKFFVEDLPDSWNNSLYDKNNPRIYRCGKFCGSNARELDKKLYKAPENVN